MLRTAKESFQFSCNLVEGVVPKASGPGPNTAGWLGSAKQTVAETTSKEPGRLVTDSTFALRTTSSFKEVPTRSPDLAQSAPARLLAAVTTGPEQGARATCRNMHCTCLFAQKPSPCSLNHDMPWSNCASVSKKWARQG